jgi:hypothetical protein
MRLTPSRQLQVVAWGPSGCQLEGGLKDARWPGHPRFKLPVLRQPLACKPFQGAVRRARPAPRRPQWHRPTGPAPGSLSTLLSLAGKLGNFHLKWTLGYITTAMAGPHPP